MKCHLRLRHKNDSESHNTMGSEIPSHEQRKRSKEMTRHEIAT
ncbi:hypothetical protein AVEN_252994-1, partial [Araneus ventricosus]